MSMIIRANGFADVCLLPCGKSTFMAFGVTIVDVIMKNINNRKIISVIEDIENPESTFVVLLIAISLLRCRFVEHVDELDSGILHLEHKVRYL